MSFNHVYGLTVKVLPATSTKGTRYRASYYCDVRERTVHATVPMCYSDYQASEYNAAVQCAAKVGKVVVGAPIMVGKNCVVYALAAK